MKSDYDLEWVKLVFFGCSTLTIASRKPEHGGSNAVMP